MQFGLFVQPIHAPWGNLADNLEGDREMVICADRLGFDECWVGEHVSAPGEPITSPLIFCASLLESTKRIKLGTGVINLPLHNPATIAAQVALFDQLSRGRFQMGIGPGGLKTDHELFDLADDPAKRGQMMLESIDMIQKIWAGEPPYEIKGRFWNVSVKDVSRLRVGIGDFIKPYQKPHPPIAVSLLSPDSQTASIAGACGWIPMSGASLVQPRYVAGRWPLYAEAADKAGRKADRKIWRVLRSVWVDETDEAAEEYVSQPDGVFDFYFDYVWQSFAIRNTLHLIRPDGRENDESVTRLDVAKSQVAWGSPDTVLDKLVALYEELGGFGVLILTAHEWDDKVRCRRSMELFTEKVAPKLQQHFQHVSLRSS